jgi:hypothetical protein
MSETTPFETFMQRTVQRPLPQNPMTRIRILAKELAEGAAVGLWGISFRMFRGQLVTSEDQQDLLTYLNDRWNKAWPHFGLLISNGYLKFDAGENDVYLTKAAFDLIDESEPANVFISYKRSDSSAFALLVLARMKAAGIEPFLDLALQPGDDWEKGLKGRIEKYQYLVVLLSHDTLKSEVCIKEISWAIEAGLAIIPIWHNGFVYKSGAWDALSVKVDTALSKTHTIRVIEESALGYNNAIVELLNRFGVMPD